MSLFRSSVRPAAVVPDDSVLRYLAAVRPDVEPDPLFRRRLRGLVVNRFVSVREGLDAPARRSSQMGRLGRACLYASFILVASVGGTMAASRGALPGDLLYPVKLEVESIRTRTLPAHMRDELAAYVLAERINELGRLVDAGQLERVAGLAPAVRGAYAHLTALSMTDTLADGALGSRLEVLEGLLEVLPPEAHEAIDRAMDRGPAEEDAVRNPGWQTEAWSVTDGAATPPGARAEPDRGGHLDSPAAERRTEHGGPTPEADQVEPEIAPLD